jgi:hypothetical protein
MAIILSWKLLIFNNLKNQFAKVNEKNKMEK